MIGQGDGLAVGVLNGGHVHGHLGGAHAHGNGQRHGGEEVRGVVFLVDHLVADQRPACGLGDFDVQALLAVEAQGVGHDERRGAGDRDKADF